MFQNQRVVSILIILVFILSSVYVTYSLTPSKTEEKHMITGLQKSKIDGIIDNKDSSSHISEWEDATEITRSYSNFGNSPVSIKEMTKYVNGQFYVALSFDDDDINLASIDSIVFQIDTNNDASLNNGDIRVRLKVQHSSVLSSEPYFMKTKQLMIEILDDQQWTNIFQMLDNNDTTPFEISSIDYANHITNRVSKWNIEFRFDISRAKNLLNTIGYSSEIVNIDNNNIGNLQFSNQILLTNNLLFTYPEISERIDPNDRYQFGSEEYTDVHFEMEPPGRALIDVGVDHIELVQAVQSETNGVILVQDKMALLRVFIDNPTGLSRSLRITVEAYTVIFASYKAKLGSFDQIFDAPANPFDRGKINDTANFEIPKAWMSHPNIVINVELDPLGFSDPTPEDNTFWQTFELLDTYDLNMYRIRMDTGGVIPMNRYEKINTYYELTTPMTPDYFFLGSEILGYVSSYGDDIDNHFIEELNGLIYSIKFTRNLQIAAGVPESLLLPVPDQIHGTTTEAGKYLGLSDPYWADGMSYSSWATGWATYYTLMPHEVNHNIVDIPHAYHIGGCDASDDDYLWNSWYGNDTYGIQDYGWNPIDGLLDKSKIDYQSYCTDGRSPEQWVSGYRWNAHALRYANFIPGYPDPRIDARNINIQNTLSSNNQDIDTSISALGEENTVRLIDVEFHNKSGEISAKFGPSFEMPGIWENNLPEWNSSYPYFMEITYNNDSQVRMGLHAYYDIKHGHTTTPQSVDPKTVAIQDNGEIKTIDIFSSNGTSITNEPLVYDTRFTIDNISWDSPRVISRNNQYDFSIDYQLSNNSDVYFQLQYSPDTYNWFPLGQPQTNANFSTQFTRTPGTDSGNFRLLVSNGLDTRIFSSPEVVVEHNPPEVRISNSDTYTKSDSEEDRRRVKNRIIANLGTSLKFTAETSNQLGHDLNTSSLHWYVKGMSENLEDISESYKSETNQFTFKFLHEGTYNISLIGIDAATGMQSSDYIIVEVKHINYNDRQVYDDFVNGLEKSTDAEEETRTESMSTTSNGIHLSTIAVFGTIFVMALRSTIKKYR